MQDAVMGISNHRTLQKGCWGVVWSREEHCLGLVGQLIWSRQRIGKNNGILSQQCRRLEGKNELLKADP